MSAAAQSSTDLLVASIAAVPATMAAVAAWVSAKRTKRSIGNPNGQGNVIEMLEHTIGQNAILQSSLTAHMANDAHEFAAIREALERARIIAAE